MNDTDTLRIMPQKKYLLALSFREEQLVLCASAGLI